MRIKTSPFLQICTLLSLVSVGEAATLPRDAYVPDTVVIDGERLVQAKARLQRGDDRYIDALAHITAQADYWLDQGPWSVTSKSKEPPGGSIHDYASQAPYWWPNPDTPDGCPYVQRDGERNPEVNAYQDRVFVGKMFNSSYKLSLAWYYTGEEKYSRHAAEILRTWFIDEATMMNPNLNHAQIIPCRNTGRSIGIIDFSQEYTNVLDAAAILASGNAPGWTEQDRLAFKDWNSRFLVWLTESEFGRDEAEAHNNHGTFANMQITALALFTGDKAMAAATAQKAYSFIDAQISADGEQPDEIARTRSWHYSNFNMLAYLRWALAAKKVGVDLFGYKGPAGQSLFGAMKYILPAAVGGSSAWPHRDLDFKPYAATDNVQAVANAGLCQAKRAVGELPPPPGGDSFVLRPAPQQLDSVAAT